MSLQAPSSCSICSSQYILIGDILDRSITENELVHRIFLAHVEIFINCFENKTFKRSDLLHIVTKFVKDQGVKENRTLEITKRDISTLCQELFIILKDREVIPS